MIPSGVVASLSEDQGEQHRDREPVRNGDQPDSENAGRRSRSALPMTETELKLMAAAAIIGERSSPKNGYSAPAAIGTPAAL